MRTPLYTRFIVSVSLGTALLSTSCAQHEAPTAAAKASAPPQVELVQRAESSIRSGVGLDPAAAQFRNVYVVEGNVVCGEVTWKDLAGKQVGFRPFLYRYGIEVKDDENLQSARFAQVWQQLCDQRPVIFGERARLPSFQQDTFTQRLQKLAAVGGKEEPEMFHKFYWANLDQIATDLDPDAAQQVQSAAEARAAEAAEFTDKIRKDLSRPR